MSKESALRMAAKRNTIKSIHRQVCKLQKEGEGSASLIAAARLVAASAMPDMQGKVLISVEAFQATNAAIAKAEGHED